MSFWFRFLLKRLLATGLSARPNSPTFNGSFPFYEKAPFAPAQKLASFSKADVSKLSSTSAVPTVFRQT